MMTEQGAFLDGYDDAGAREHGSNKLLDTLGRCLTEGTANRSLDQSLANPK
jgi:hypothetical protein